MCRVVNQLMDMVITFISNRISNKRPKGWAFLFFGLFLLTGCWEDYESDNISCGDGQDTEYSTVEAPPAGTSFDYGDRYLTKAVQFSRCSQPVEQIVSVTETGDIVFIFYTQESYVDFSNVIANRNEEVSFVYFPNESDKKDIYDYDSLVLYVPCTENTASLLVCPGVSSFGEIAEGCASSVTLAFEPVDQDEAIPYYWANPYDPPEGAESDCTISISISDLGNGFGAKAL